VLIMLAAAAVVIWGIYSGRAVIGPIALAMVLTVIVHPVRYRLEEKGWPRWLATTSVIAVVYLVLAVLAALLIAALAQFTLLLPEYADDFDTLAQSAEDSLIALGLSSEIATSAVDSFSPAGMFDITLGALGSLVSGTLTLFLVLAYVIFMAADAAYTRVIVTRFDSSHHDLLAALTRYSVGVRRYFVVNTIFGAVVATLDGLALWALGIPGAFIWAVLAFVTNFIPNIGFVVGLIPPLVLALLTGGWGPALVVLAVYCVVNVTLQVLLQPRFISRAVDLSFTITFVAVIFWGAVMGALGALLAVPMTLLVKALLVDRYPDAAFARALTGNPEGLKAVAPDPAEHPE
jgi:predicted PurR-regulated permease PerM